jgi:predicted nucleotide-binding protein
MPRNPPPRQPQGPTLSPKQARIELERSLKRAKELSQEQPLTKQRYDAWRGSAFEMLKAAFGESHTHISSFVGQTRVVPTFGPVPEHEQERGRRERLKEKIAFLEAVIEEFPPIDVQTHNTKIDPTSLNKVFIVHGHNDALKYEIAHSLQRAGLDVTILHEQPNKGRTVLEKFSEHAAEAGFAVVLLTADDIGRVKEAESTVVWELPRARQNVVFELGFFCGLLGRGRVCAVYETGVELPSDLHGLAYVEYDSAGVWKHAVAKEIDAAGIKVDFSKL